MNKSSPDVGIIQTFRVFAVVKWIVAVSPLFLAAINPNPRAAPFQTNPIISIAESIFLIIYLSLPWLQKKLTWAYLPLALAIATVIPILSNIITFDPHIAEEVGRARALANQWQLTMLLIVPLIFVSWLYNFRAVIIYSIGVGLLYMGILLPLPTLPDRLPWFEFAPMLFQTGVFFLVGYIVSRLVSNQREQTEKLRQAYRQLANYATTNEQLTLSRERNRLARELHDTLAHTLSAVAVQLEAVTSLWDNDRSRASELLHQSLKMTRDGLSETRRAIQSLRAAPIEEMGLVMALSNLSRSFADRYQLTLDLQLPETASRWEAEIENSFYRIAEEALRNVAEHSGAVNLWVILTDANGQLELTIRDNGRGFAPGQTVSDETRFGLQGMRERSSAIGARFDVISEPGKGTTVSVAYKEHKS